MPRVAQRIRGIQTYRSLRLPPAYAGSPFIVLPIYFRKSGSQLKAQVSLVLRLN